MTSRQEVADAQAIYQAAAMRWRQARADTALLRRAEAEAYTEMVEAGRALADVIKQRTFTPPEWMVA